MVGSILNDIVKVNILEPIQERIDQEELDSLLNDELASRGITAKYGYGIFDKGNKVLIKSKLIDEQNDVGSSNYETRLFMNDIVFQDNKLRLFFPRKRGYLLQKMWVMLVVSALLMLAVFFAFSYTIRTIIRQKKVSEIKSDFINNMTHELKTPISTISLACEALSDTSIEKSAQMQSSFLSMIKDENIRLSALVERVLQSAVLEKGEMKLRLESLNMNELVDDAVNHIRIKATEKQGEIKVINRAERPLFEGDKIHLVNVIYNLLDNAIKYTPTKPEINVWIENGASSVILSVEDNGIGITKAEQKKIFDKLYRVPTGNVHDVKGFGLGLSYVKTIVDLHKGIVKVDSELGKGSKFTIEIPQ